MSSLWLELKRRNVVRIGALYAVAGWLLLQMADILFGLLDVPGWGLRLVLGLLLLGFPLALIFSWVYEMTSDGLKRESEIDHGESITPTTGRKSESPQRWSIWIKRTGQWSISKSHSRHVKSIIPSFAATLIFGRCMMTRDLFRFSNVRGSSHLCRAER